MSEVVGKMTAEEMLARFDRISDRQPDPEDDAKTKRGWAEYLKADRTRIAQKIDSAIIAGEMEAVQRRRRSSNGSLYTVTCYRWVK